MTDACERVSLAIFRNKHQLSVLAAVARVESDDWLWAREIADRSGVRDNQVGPILKRLAAAGLLRQMTSPTGGGQRILFARIESPLWRLVIELEGASESEATDA